MTESHRLWRYQKSLPDVASPVLYKGALYLVRNGGIVTTLDPTSGEVLKQGRLPDAIDAYYSSPVAGDDKIYMLSETGKAVVLEAGSDWAVLGANNLGEEG